MKDFQAALVKNGGKYLVGSSLSAADITVAGTDHMLRATGSSIAFDGFMKAYSEGKDQVAAVTAARPAILDPGNAHVIEEAFTFSADKQKVRALF